MQGNEFLTTALQILIPALITAVSAVIIALGNRIADYLKQKSNSNILNRYIDLLDRTVVDVVQGLNQSMVDDLKSAAADGKLTDEEIRMISSKALDSVKAILGVTGIEILKLAFEDVDALITSKIERTVREYKCEKGVSVNGFA